MKKLVTRTKKKSIKLIKDTKDKTKKIIFKAKKFVGKEQFILIKNKVLDIRLYLADMFSFFNLACGLASILAAINHKFTLAAVFILAGVTFDSFDGKIARHFQRETLLGLQLDSLADLVTFSVAVVILANVQHGMTLIILIPAFLHVSAGAFRLARYNVMKLKEPDMNVYLGTPITWNGVIFPVALLLKAPAYIIGCLILIMSILMISKIRIKKII